MPSGRVHLARVAGNSPVKGRPVSQDVAAPDAATTRTLVTALLDDMYGAFMERDWERFNAHLTQDVTAWESHLPEMMRGLDELQAYRARRGEPAPLAGLTFDLTDLDVWGDVAVARYILTAHPIAPEAASSSTRVSEILRWNGTRWLIAHRHAEGR